MGSGEPLSSMAVAAVPEDSSTVPSCVAHHGQSDGRLRIRMKRRRATTTVATGTATTVSAPTSATVTAASCDLILAALALVQDPHGKEMQKERHMRSPFSGIQWCYLDCLDHTYITCRPFGLTIHRSLPSIGPRRHILRLYLPGNSYFKSVSDLIHHRHQ